MLETAGRYDFPEARGLAGSFLERFPLSRHRPATLFRMARHLRMDKEPKRANQLLRNIIANWPDAAVHVDAQLRLANWHNEDRKPALAARVLDALLEQTGIPSRKVAQALLLRAKCDLLAGNSARSRLGCQRIIALYPAFVDIHTSADQLLQSIGGKVEDAEG